LRDLDTQSRLYGKDVNIFTTFRSAAIWLSCNGADSCPVWPYFAGAVVLKKLFARKDPHRVHLVRTGDRFEVGRNKTVLECALESGIAFPHDCTVGTCGSCRCKLLRGKVDAITPFGYTLSREELEGGYILACQAVPESDLEIEIELGAAAPVVRTGARLITTQALTHDILKVTWQTELPVTYQAGQYMNVSWPGAPGPRSYSFSAAPGAGGLTQLSTFIRKVPGGAFTEKLFAGELAAAAFEIDAPHGNFWLRDGQGPLLLVGGGSGLSPLMSLLEDAAARGVKRDALLLFGGRSVRDLYCLDAIAVLAGRWQGRFEFWPVLSEEQASGHRFGLVTHDIPAAIHQLGGIEGLQAYMCGPPGMIDAGLASLAEAGVSLGQIHYDKFTDASSLAR
jgi:p-cymene methyl-monooxygenase electron transfer component